MLRSNDKEKRKFLTSKGWKTFKQLIFNRYYGLDRVTLKRLSKGWNCHHEDLDPTHYQILNPARFSPLNKQTHDVVHFCYRHYLKDPEFINRLQELLDEMVKYNEVK